MVLAGFVSCINLAFISAKSLQVQITFFFLAIYSAIVEFHFVLFTSVIDYIFGVIEKDCPAVL